MKLKITTAALAVIVLLGTNIYGQSNNIKINLAALLLDNISLQDEYTLNGHSTVALGFSFLPTRGLPKSLSKKDSTGHIADLRFGGFSITPEYRYYFTGKAPQGFYVAGYFRYTNYTVDNYTYNYTNSSDITKQYTLNGNWTVAALGVMIGSQWTIGDHFTFDWWIRGAAFGKNEGKISGTGPLSPSDEASIQKSINDVKVPFGTLTSAITSDSVDMDYKPGLPAIRGFGFCFGYRFGKG